MQYVVSSPRHRAGGIPSNNGNSNNNGNRNSYSHANTSDALTVTDTDEGKTYTVEDAVESLSLGWFQVKLFVVGKVITAADAMEMMMLAVLSPLVRCEWALKDYQVALITTSVFVGMGVSAPLLGA
ncbi:hypothetical protein EGW08_021616, partial [Elysia chlorotica]